MRRFFGRLDLVDVVLSAVVLALGIVEYVVANHRSWTESLPVLLLGSVAVLVRTVAPVPAAVLATAVLPVSVWGELEQESLWAWLPAVLVLYTVGARCRPRAFVPVLAVVVLMLVLMRVQGPEGMGDLDYFFLTLLLAGALAVGRAGREIHTEAEEVRRSAAAERVAREREMLAAAAEERLRIARELHDVLGHTVSVMGLQAAAVRRRLGPDQVVEAEALRKVEEVGREAVVELKRLLAALRTDGSAGEPTGFEVEGMASSARLDAVVGEVRAAGVRVEVSGGRLVDEVPPAVALTVLRVVQEGLTNVLRHAPGATARVRIAREAEGLHVSIQDDGSGGRTEPAGAGPGFGLVGLRERAAVFGGTLVAGARQDGGFDLDVTLPVTSPVTVPVVGG